jgi:large subunit ribosomal protein L37Ae
MFMANANIRYGARIRKHADQIRKQKIARYKCEYCGKVAVRRLGTGIWKCKHCARISAGGAYTMTTPQGEASRRLIAAMK